MFSSVSVGRKVAVGTGSSHNPWNKRSRILFPSPGSLCAAAERVMRQTAENQKNNLPNDAMVILGRVYDQLSI